MASSSPAATQKSPQPAQASAGGESFAALFEESLNRKEMRVGEVITAEVLSVDDNWVVVNAGLKSESIIPAEEFKNDAGQVDVKTGDFVSVSIEALEDGFGATRLSRDKAKRMAAWLELEKALENGEKVKGVITGKVKGGLTVMAKGIRAFLPGSLVDLRPVKDTTPYEGKQMQFKVIKLDRKRNNVVVSRRAVLEETAGAEREQLLASLQEGATVKGIVKNITDYGAFVDLGGIDGLLHITDLAWRRVKHPSEVLNVGDEVTAKVLKFDAEKNRVSLGLKQLGEDPWVGIARRYPQGTRLFGKVNNLTDYGAFVGGESGVAGLGDGRRGSGQEFQEKRRAGSGGAVDRRRARAHFARREADGRGSVHQLHCEPREEQRRAGHGEVGRRQGCRSRHRRRRRVSARLGVLARPHRRPDQAPEGGRQRAGDDHQRRPQEPLDQSLGEGEGSFRGDRGDEAAAHRERGGERRGDESGRAAAREAR